MNIAEYCRARKITIKSVSDACGIPYSTANDIINGRISLEKTSYGSVKKIAEFLSVSLEELEELASDRKWKRLYHPWDIIVKNKCYYLKDVSGRYGEEKLCKVNPLNTVFVESMAQRRILEAERKERLEVIWRQIIT